jgi:hypothetical protein
VDAVTLDIRNTTVFRGPNVWARMRAIAATLAPDDAPAATR